MKPLKTFFFEDETQVKINFFLEKIFFWKVSLKKPLLSLWTGEKITLRSLNFVDFTLNISPFFQKINQENL